MKSVFSVLPAVCCAVGMGGLCAWAEDPICRIVYEGHLPKVEVNGRIYEPDFRLTNYDDKTDPTYDNQALRHLADVGFRFFRMHCEVDEAYHDDGKYDFSFLDGRAKHILDLVPNAFLEFTIRFNMEKWCAAHPSEIIQYAAGPADPKFPGDECTGRPIRPSVASDAYRAEALFAARAAAEWIRSRPWGARVVAVRPCWGIYTEWHMFGMYQAPDVGPAMSRAFRDHVAKQHGEASSGDAIVPTVAERGCGATLLDPVKDRRMLDYYGFMANLGSDFLLSLAHTFKTCLPGRLVGAYYGYIFTPHPPEGANAQLAKVLASSDIDFLSCPPIYSGETRLAGGSNMSRSVPSTFHRYGKLMLSEDDSRFHHIKGYVEANLVMRSPEESRAVMKRNYCNKLFDGCGIQLHDPNDQFAKRPYAFDDPHVLRALSESKAAFAKAGALPVESGNETVLVVSERERLRRDGAVKYSALTGLLYYTVPQALWRTGVAYDVVTLEDYLEAKRTWRNVLFLNVFHLTDVERTQLAEKVRGSGTTAIWLAAPGSVTDAGFSDRAMSELTGVELAGSGIAPKIVCHDDAAKNGPCGSFIKSVGDSARAVILSVPPSAWTDWRKLFDHLNVRADASGGNYFRRHGDVFMFHVGQGGTYTLQVPDLKPGDAVVELFSGKRYNVAPLSLATSFPDTWLFRIERK